MKATKLCGQESNVQWVNELLDWKLSSLISQILLNAISVGNNIPRQKWPLVKWQWQFIPQGCYSCKMVSQVQWEVSIWKKWGGLPIRHTGCSWKANNKKINFHLPCGKTYFLDSYIWDCSQDPWTRLFAVYLHHCVSLKPKIKQRTLKWFLKKIHVTS